MFFCSLEQTTNRMHFEHFYVLLLLQLALSSTSTASRHLVSECRAFQKPAPPSPFVARLGRNDKQERLRVSI